ncbi:class I SAM-dependent methyltransferase family protein [Serratia sp. NPDC071084]
MLSQVIYYFQQFIDHVKATYHVHEQDISIVSHGDRAVIVAAWLTDYAANIRAVVLSSPLFIFKKSDLLRTCVKSSYFGLFHRRGAKSTPECGVVESIYRNRQQDNLLPIGCTTRRRMSDLLYTGQRIARNSFAYSTPTQLILSKEDRRYNMASQLAFYANIDSTEKTLCMLPDRFYIGAGKDVERNLLNKIRNFLVDRFAEPHIAPSLFDAHLTGVTYDEYEKLRLPESNVVKRLYWWANKLALKHIGQYATAIKLGLKTGFDSGASLDCIYQNQPSGRYFLGKIIDRYYLNNIGFHCTRIRKMHVEELMLLAVDALVRQQKNIKLLDTAAGHGRYILETVSKIKYPIAHILMRDFEPSNVLHGQALIRQNNLEGIATFEQGDAFSCVDLETLPEDRTLTIVSGFYELFSDNRLVQTSLEGIAKASEQDGYLIYTTKLWNPKLEYMARVLNSHKTGEYWRLRRRTQREIDQLVSGAGFVKVTQRIDPWGMFSVTLAQKSLLN